MALLIRNLPLESRTFLVQSEEPHWTRQDHLLAGILDALAIMDWHFVCAHTPEDKETPDPPQRIPRPGVPGEDADSAPAGQPQSGEQGAVVVQPTDIAAGIASFLSWQAPDSNSNLSQE